MKKILLPLFFLLMFIPALCSADVTPTITSDTRTFSPMTGIYDLKGNVFVQWPIKDSDMTITADETQVHLYAMEVHGQGNITLSFGNMAFYCDKVDVYHSDRTAYVSGDLLFDDGKVEIEADKGSYCWRTKLAYFSGDVVVDGKPKDGDVIYNVKEQKFETAESAKKIEDKKKKKS